MIRVFVAGKYNDENVINVLRNMREGIELSLRVIDAGMSPFCPWLDFQFGLKAEMPVKKYQELSMAWLEVADAVLLNHNWERSGGARRELARAVELGIPVFCDLDELKLWAYQMEAD